MFTWVPGSPGFPCVTVAEQSKRWAQENTVKI